MKTFKLTIGLFLLWATVSQAQVSVNVNIGSPPAWGPAGYNEVEYYYLPDLEVYYDVHATQYIYHDHNGWIRSRYLPRQYRHYDLYNGYKVVLNDYHGPRPYTHFKTHKVKYHKGYSQGLQKTIGAKKSHNNGNVSRGSGSKGSVNKGHVNKENGNKGHGNKGHGKK